LPEMALSSTLKASDDIGINPLGFLVVAVVTVIVVVIISISRPVSIVPG
ncbi:hypothetical protein Tco_0198185, partial [Tanacetum coccineum]